MIDQERLAAIFHDCLFRPEEIPAGKIPPGAVIVEAISSLGLGFHPDRLESHRAEVAGMLEQLPVEFMASKGGGWSFLNACRTRGGDPWTGFHLAMEQLFVLGIGLGMASYLAPRGDWPAFPGGMPYLIVDDSRVAEALASPAVPA